MGKDPELIVRVNYKQADFLLGLLDAGTGMTPLAAIQLRAKTRHELAMRGVPFEPLTAQEIDKVLFGRVLLISRGISEDGQIFGLTHCGKLVAQILSGDTVHGHVKDDVIDGMKAYAVYDGPAPQAKEPEELKVPITGKYLQGLLQALMGPGHLIRELQATINLPRDMTGDFVNPLREVLEEYNAFVEANTKKG